MTARINFSYFFIMQFICILFFTTSSQAQPALEWTAQLTGESSSRGNSVATDKFGNVYVAGWLYGKIDLDNGSGNSPVTSSNTWNLLVSKYDSSGTLLWAKTTEAGLTFKIAVDDSCNVYILGSFTETVDFDPGPGVYNLTQNGTYYLYVSKWDSSGSFLWANKFNFNLGLTYQNNATSITINSSGVVRVVGSIIDDRIFIAEYDNVGVLTYSRIIFLGNDVDFESLSVDASGNIIIVGIFHGALDFDPGPGVHTLYSAAGSIFILKLTSQGDFIWANNLGNQYSTNLSVSIVTDSSKNIYFSGQITDTVDFDLGPGVYNLISDPTINRTFIACFDSSSNFVFAKLLDRFIITNLSIMTNNSLVASGEFSVTVDFDPGPLFYTLAPPNSKAGFLARYDLTGNFNYAKIIGGKSLATLNIDVNSNIFMTGYFDKTTDFDPSQAVSQLFTQVNLECIFLCKIDSSGNLKWVKGSKGSQAYPYDQDVDQDGNFYTTGYFAGNVDFDPDTSSFFLNYTGDKDVFIQKINSSGQLAWAKSFGGNDAEFGYKVKSDNSGNVYISGTFYGTIDCDPGPAIYNLTPPGILPKSTFLLKLDESGNFVWATTIFDYEIDNNLNYNMEVGESGNIYFIGVFSETIDLDPGPGNFYLTADFGPQSNVFLMKLNNNGIFEWGRSIETTSVGTVFGRNISVDGEGNSIFSGEFFTI
ncbi:MAG: SBBP repeat-containing protein [Bacteroidetes bacterium]|nr:SBBP repeat-containing protein [Bacteroidota bacterium]